MLNFYYQKPFDAVPILIKRLNQKINSWVDLSYSYKLMWRKQLSISHKNFARNQFLTSKQIDLKQLQPKTIIENILNDSNSEQIFYFESNLAEQDTTAIVLGILKTII